MPEKFKLHEHKDPNKINKINIFCMLVLTIFEIVTLYPLLLTSKKIARSNLQIN
jgi:hypothetical protein